MKNITLSAEESLIEGARNEARLQRTTLNQLFREWLGEISKKREREDQVTALLSRMDYVQSGGPFPRETMNER